METDLVRVWRVSQTETQRLGMHQYVIDTEKVADRMPLQLQTVSPIGARQCERARDEKRAIAVTWERTKYGPTLRKAEFLRAEV